MNGGAILRRLRKARKLAILEVTTEASITYRTLSKIERGFTHQPSKETIESVMAALDDNSMLSSEDYHAVFDAFGYKTPHPLPKDNAIQWARGHWRQAYSEVWYPAYLIDFSQRLLDWNQYAPRLIGMRWGDLRLEAFENITIFDMTFGMVAQLVTIENREEYLPDLIRTMKTEFLPYRDEIWYPRLIKEAKCRYPEFEQLWDSIPDSASDALFAGNTVPIILSGPYEGHLKFRLLRVDFASDQRFRVVQWIPVDELTALQCLLWKKQEDAGK